MRRRLLLTGAWVAAYLIGLLVLIVPLRLLALPDDLRSALWLTLPAIAASWIVVRVGDRIR